MILEQFYDKGLAHASYSIISDSQMLVIDPGRDPQPYFDFAEQHQARLIGVIETHAHADFISAHLEIHQKTGATIYVSKLLKATYPHQCFDESAVIKLGKIKLKAISTPGHSPDSICVLLIDEHEKETAIFTGDTLFVGAIGRPDLPEQLGEFTRKKEELAKQMYHSIWEKLMKLPKDILVYPAHGPGSLCGKNISPDLHSTIGRELRENYALQPMDESEFIKALLKDQPFIPRYFAYDVWLNKKGAGSFEESAAAVPRIDRHTELEKGMPVIDARSEKEFKAGHVKDSINLQDGVKFETWLGTIIAPYEQFYLIAADTAALEKVIYKSTKIGYETFIKGALLTPNYATEVTPTFDIDDFVRHTEKYTVVDVRNDNEISQGKIFDQAITLPLPELRSNLSKLPADKPIIVHCAGGYRSTIGSSIVAGALKEVPVYDMGAAIRSFYQHH